MDGRSKSGLGEEILACRGGDSPPSRSPTCSRKSACFSPTKERDVPNSLDLSWAPLQPKLALSGAFFLSLLLAGGTKMRRDNLIKSLLGVSQALIESGAQDIFMYLVRTGGSGKESPYPAKFYNDALRGYSKFMLHYANFSVEEKLVLKEFGLEILALSETWLTGKTPDGKKTFTYLIRMTIDSIAITIRLLQRETDKREIVVDAVENNKAKSFDTKKLTFIIPEGEVPSLTLKELSLITSDIESIFQAIIKLEGAGPSELVVAALDSGSEKSIDVAGIASAIDKLSGFLLEAWDRIRFARSSKVRVSIKAASEGLTLLNELSAAREKGSISPEEAEKLKRVVLKGVDELFSKGVYTKEMQESVPVRPNQLEYQRTKLITHYKESSEPKEKNLRRSNEGSARDEQQDIEED